MSWWILLLLQTGIGAAIGGVTNELAIRMLFRPYRAIYFGKWRVPFTPGLIPKRHEELAVEMGKLVENFLITPDAVRRMLKKGDIDKQIENWLQGKLSEWEKSDKTLASILSDWGVPLEGAWGEGFRNQIKLHLASQLSKTSYSTLDEVLPEQVKVLIENKIHETAPFIMDKFAEYVDSEEGSHLIRQMLNQLSGGLGMLGGLAGMLLSDEKVVAKVSGSLQSGLKNEELKEKLGMIFSKELKKLYQKQVGDVIRWIGEERVEEAIQVLVDRVARIEKLGDKKLGEFMELVLPTLRESVPKLVSNLLRWVEERLDDGIKKLNLTRIAASQVETFPVQKLEEMILHITGKELKMITVFGAILGGLIGAIQSLIVIFYQ